MIEHPRTRRAPTRMMLVVTVAVAVVAAAIVGIGLPVLGPTTDVPSFTAQACGLSHRLLRETRRGYFEPRSGQISLLPRAPAYMATGAGGWSHSGPWPYLQDVPLVFYGPGLVPGRGDVDRPATIADVAPTLARFMRGTFDTSDGSALPEVAPSGKRLVTGPMPRLVVTIVWDGGGWNVLRRYPGSWPNLKRLMEAGVSYTHAIVGSSPSVTPAVHTTLGTGVFPWKHGITGVPVRDDEGEVVDSFLQGESSAFIEVPTLAERWDEQNGNRARIGMVGYEPWHLGMIGQGAERLGGDRDDAAWLDIETNEWITNRDHYRLPPSLGATRGLDRDLRRLDGRDGEVDGAWGAHAILDDPGRVEETPAFIAYHARSLANMIEDEGYGADDVTDLLFTNFKQIDRVGHYFNMNSPEVRESLAETDRQLGRIVDHLDRRLGRGRYLVVVTADHGQQPDASVIDSYAVQPNEVESDMAAEFGPIVRAVWPTEAFLYPDEMDERGVTVAEVARWLADYRVRDNTKRPDILLAGAGRFDPGDRVFEMAVPSSLLAELECPGSP